MAIRGYAVPCQPVPSNTFGTGLLTAGTPARDVSLCSVVSRSVASGLQDEQLPERWPALQLARTPAERRIAFQASDAD